jgi:hypothetical protein
MKALFAGTPGVRKSLALENLRAAARKLVPEERILTLDAGGGAREVPVLEKLIYGSNPIPFLKQSQQTQKQQWRETFTRVRAEFDRAQHDNHFLGLHFTYRYQRIPFCAADFRMLVDWKPERIITFIDDAYFVRERIHRGGYKSFTLSELVLWRAEEMLIGDLLARTINPDQPPPNFLVSVKHPAEMLAKLLFKQPSNGNQVENARVYLSYSITDTRNNERFRKIIDSFRERMHKTSCAAFDPLTIDELPPVLRVPTKKNKVYRYDASNPQHRWPILNPKKVLGADDDLHYPISFPFDELRDVREAIDAQVRARDIRLVDQAHFLVVYRPTFVGPGGNPSPKLGSGVQGEVDYAAATGCPTVWYIKKGADPLPASPFVPKNPGDDPDFVVEPTEERFWARIETLQKDIKRSRDHFLR